jgi:hypothetical protein
MTNAREDVVMRAAFAPARTLEPTEAEVARVLARARTRRRPLFRERRVALATAAIGLFIAATAGAATGLLPVGSVIPLSKEPQGDGLTYTSDRTIVATGASDIAGRWRLSLAQSNQGFCVAIELLDDPLARAGNATLAEGCGGGSRSFDAASLGGGAALPDTTLVYGPSPEEAKAVRVTAGGFSRTAKTHEGPADVPGNFYVVEIPRKGLRNAVVTWLDAEGHEHQPGIFVPSTIDYSLRPSPPSRPR